MSTVCTSSWTKYYDRDDPTSGDGDDEKLDLLKKENPHEICFNPTAVDARVVGEHSHYSQVRQTLTVGPKQGLKCLNYQQKNSICLDYEVRFCCRSEQYCSVVHVLCLWLVEFIVLLPAFM